MKRPITKRTMSEAIASTATSATGHHSNSADWVQRRAHGSLAWHAISIGETNGCRSRRRPAGLSRQATPGVPLIVRRGNRSSDWHVVRTVQTLLLRSRRDKSDHMGRLALFRAGAAGWFRRLTVRAGSCRGSRSHPRTEPSRARHMCRTRRTRGSLCRVTDHRGSGLRIDVDPRVSRGHDDSYSAANDATAPNDRIHDLDDSRAHHDDQHHKHDDNDEHDNHDDNNTAFHHLVRARHCDAATDDCPAEATRTLARKRCGALSGASPKTSSAALPCTKHIQHARVIRDFRRMLPFVVTCVALHRFWLAISNARRILRG
jgi:hypothetical protein